MTTLDRVAKATAALREGDIVKMADLVREVADPPPAPAAPAKVPMAAVITEAQQGALARLTEVFGSVVPTERRALTDEESTLLYEERVVVSSVEDLVAKRKAAIRTTVANHLDCLFEAEADEATLEETPRDKDGHYITPQRVPAAPGFEWCREPTGGTSNPIGLSDLQALVDDEDSPFTHQDLLAMTEPVRVVDENRFMLHLKKNPDLVAEIAKVGKIAPRSATVQPRKAK
jgi:hypothetical protein